LSVVLAPELVADAQVLNPRRVAIVRNGIDDPGSFRSTERVPGAPTSVLFLGLCTPQKGIFATLQAVELANRRSPAAFRLVVAGGFIDAKDEQAFSAQAAALGPGIVQHVGFASEEQKHTLLARADVFCFPTTHPHEGQPLSIIEALAHDLPIITTRWRGIPGMLPAGQVWFVEPGHPEQITDALIASRSAGPRHGERRKHFLAHFTRDRHLVNLASALTTLQ
jgi:glycosyltransferase involved in cell wall biosynthesis